MLCRNPYGATGGAYYGCGRCPPCRFNARRVWQTRMIFEARCHPQNAFVTLTYDDKNLPADRSLSVTDALQFLDRLRHRKSVAPFRYYIVGEYGDKTQRPHYHAALFNFPTCLFGQSTYARRRSETCCRVCDLVREVWGKGNIYLGKLEPDSAGYVAGYIGKKMTRKDDTRLKGRAPEFGRMSRMPGIGANYAHQIATSYGGPHCDIVDVLPVVRIDGKMKPIGRFMAKKVRKALGRDEKAPQATLDQAQASMQEVRLRARLDPENPSVKHHIIETGAPAAARQEFWDNVKSQRKKL